jgi:hypothetical protein
METLRKALTPNRRALLRALRGRGPSSIRHLAQLLGRDYRGVHAHKRVLVDAGLIERDDSGASSEVIALSVAGGLAATDPRLVPYGAMTATFYTGVGCLLAPSVLYFVVRALV